MRVIGMWAVAFGVMLGGMAVVEAGPLTIGEVNGHVEAVDSHFNLDGFEIREQVASAGAGDGSLSVATPSEGVTASMAYALLDDPGVGWPGGFAVEASLVSSLDSPAHADAGLHVAFSLTQATPFVFRANAGPFVPIFEARLNDDVASLFPDPDADLGRGGTLPLGGFELEGILPAGDHTFSFSLFEGTPHPDPFGASAEARLQLIPEPASAALLGLGAVSLLRRRRRSRLP